MAPRTGTRLLGAAAAVLSTLAASVLTAPAASADPPGTEVIEFDPSNGGFAWAVGLGPGRVYLTGTKVTSSNTTLLGYQISKVAPDRLSLEPQAVPDRNLADQSRISVSAGRLLTDGAELRSEGGSAQHISVHYGNAVKLSGHRALYMARNSATSAVEWPVLYSLRTGTRWEPFGSGVTLRPPMDLWGEYFVYAYNNGTVYRRDLRTGTTLQVRGPGSRIQAVVVSAHGVGWVTACPTAAPCTQTVSWRAAGTGPVKSVTTTGTSRLRMTGGYLAVDAGTGARTLNRIDAGTRAVQLIGNLRGSEPFDAADEIVAWGDGPGSVKVAPLTAHAESPRYLGNFIGFASFSPNGDGVNDLWRGAFPVSKPLPTCRVTFRKNGTPVRIIGCATTNGLAQVFWDGKTGSGNPVSKGTYTWTLTGSDSDGSLLWYNGSASAISGTVKVT
jgi:hypothetical protein